MAEAEESKVTAAAPDAVTADIEQSAEGQEVTPEVTQEVISEATRNLRKVLVGIVVSDKMERTLVVKVNRRTTHPRYRKIIQVTKKYYVHDENNEARIGDVVKIMETRPLSKLKRWRLVSIQQRAVTE